MKENMNSSNDWEDEIWISSKSLDTTIGSWDTFLSPSLSHGEWYSLVTSNPEMLKENITTNYTGTQWETEKNLSMFLPERERKKMNKNITHWLKGFCHKVTYILIFWSQSLTGSWLAAILKVAMNMHITANSYSCPLITQFSLLPSPLLALLTWNWHTIMEFIWRVQCDVLVNLYILEVTATMKSKYQVWQEYVRSALLATVKYIVLWTVATMLSNWPTEITYSM